MRMNGLQPLLKMGVKIRNISITFMPDGRDSDPCARSGFRVLELTQ